MPKTPGAVSWKPHEEQFLYDFMTRTIALNIPMYSAYKKAATAFQQKEEYTSREWNACRNRWTKIKNDPKFCITKETEFDEIPVTTGIQEEFNFDSLESFEMPDILLKETQPIAVEDIPTDLFHEAESMLARLKVRQLSLEAENANLKEELKQANRIISSNERKLEAFNKIQSIMYGVV